MYFVSKKKVMGDVKNYQVLLNLDGFVMAPRGKGFSINGQLVKKINIIEKKLAMKIVTEKVLKKYYKLIEMLTELLISDDDTGESFREALNQIEKFRLEIKNKYREFLKKKELEMMSKQLRSLKKEADRRFLEIQDSLIASKSSGKGR